VVRVLIFHGYLLSGTGSNVYNARLAEALVALGHEVHLFSQDPHPERQSFVGAVGDWDRGELRLSMPGGTRAWEPAICTVYRPNIGGLLPVYVRDRYEGIEARTFAECTEAELADYIEANVDAVREVAEIVRPDAALANHLVMGPVILARALVGGAPYAVKVHGSALEYTVKPEPERFLRFAREGLEPARTVLVGSKHTAESLWKALGDPQLERRTRLGPPGVDVERFAPRERGQVQAATRDLIERLHDSAPDSATEQASAFARDDRAAAEALKRVVDGSGPLVAFVGKLIVNKGVDLLIAAWPLVLRRQPRARLVVIGFGSERERYEAATAQLGESVIFTGRLDHDELPDVLGLCEALVVPSIFPEAFGMVAIEAAACAVLPISAAHSGLAEVSEVLAQVVPPEVRALLSFPIEGDDAVRAIAERVCGWLEADEVLREQTRAALVHTARERWSWEGVARGVLAAALGERVVDPG
jgi:glycosyltransferase involved in cell wall biosynthesis